MRAGLIASLLACAACATTAPHAPASTATSTTWRAELTFDGTAWHLDYRLPKAQRALLFDSHHGDYRTTHWTGTPIEHHAGLDAVLPPAPTTTLAFTLTPPRTPPAGTLAVVPFSDGTHALWLGQLALLTAESREAVQALQGDLRRWRGLQPEFHVHARGPLLGPDGPTQAFEARVHHGRGAYLYTGRSTDPRTIVDPGLPAWVREAFVQRLPEVQRVLDTQWSQALPAPQLMLAWGGGEGEWANRGRAEGRQIVMHVQGARYTRPDPELLGELVWFFAHELVHLQQFAGGGDGDPWMIEGLADTLATDALVRIGLWDPKVLERRYWSVARECARELGREPLSRARGRAAHVCGDLVGVALANLPRVDLPALWKQARSGPEPRVTLARLLDVARANGAPEPVLAAIDHFVTAQHGDTDAAIRALLEAAGLAPVYTDGSLSSMAFPFGR